jgi:hypothetical protein
MHCVNLPPSQVELFFLRNGLKNKLTGVFEARVVNELLA